VETPERRAKPQIWLYLRHRIHNIFKKKKLEKEKKARM